MRQLKNSFVIAFSMYSRIPMPKVNWTPENMRYVMCFFPFVGIVTGGAVYLVQYLFAGSVMSRPFVTAILLLIPLVITGGIHMDGYMDTVDALSSHQPTEKKLEILKDPHAGAFAVLGAIAYYLLAYGVWYEVRLREAAVLAIGFFLSRSLSGMAVIFFSKAKNSGLAALFASEADRRVNGILLAIGTIAGAGAMLYLNLLLGSLCLGAALLTFWFYHRMAEREFGGITGDLAGFFLQVCELVMAFTVVLGGKIFL